MKTERENLIDQINLLKTENQEYYARVKDFTLNYYATEAVMQAISDNNKIIRRLERNLAAGGVIAMKPGGYRASLNTEVPI